MQSLLTAEPFNHGRSWALRAPGGRRRTSHTAPQQLRERKAQAPALLRRACVLQRRARVRADQRSLWTDERFCSFSRRAGLCDAGVRALRVEVVPKLMSLSPEEGGQ